VIQLFLSLFLLIICIRPAINVLHSVSAVVSFFLMIPLPPISTLFPYTTLFRSGRSGPLAAADRRPGDRPVRRRGAPLLEIPAGRDRKSTRLNSSHVKISYAVFCLKKKIVVQLALELGYFFVLKENL